MIIEGFDRKAQRLATSNGIDLEDIDYTKSDMFITKSRKDKIQEHLTSEEKNCSVVKFFWFEENSIFFFFLSKLSMQKIGQKRQF